MPALDNLTPAQIEELFSPLVLEPKASAGTLEPSWYLVASAALLGALVVTLVWWVVERRARKARKLVERARDKWERYLIDGKD